MRDGKKVVPRMLAALLCSGIASCLGACELVTDLEYKDVEASPCADDLVLCNDGFCANLRTSALHCGACGRACTEGQCVDGKCNCGRFTLCTLGCMDTANDPTNCGACGRFCPSLQCNNGSCGPGCAPGLTPCPSGCVDTLSDSNNCGSCGRLCFGQCAGGLCFTQAVDAGRDAGIADADPDARDAPDGDADASELDADSASEDGPLDATEEAGDAADASGE